MQVLVFILQPSKNLEDFKEVLDVNLVGNFLMSKNALKLMKKQKYGKIINLVLYGTKVVILGFMEKAEGIIQRYIQPQRLE